MKGIPLKFIMGSCYSSFEQKYLQDKLILDENNKLFCILLGIWKSSVYFKKKHSGNHSLDSLFRKSYDDS